MAGALLGAYRTEAKPYLLVRDLPASVTDVFGPARQGNVVSFKQLREILDRPHGLSRSKETPVTVDAITLLTHAALQLQTGGFANRAVTTALHQGADKASIEANLILDLMADFVDCEYFKALARTLRKRLIDRSLKEIPIHPFESIELMPRMIEGFDRRDVESKAVDAEDDLNDLFKRVGRSTKLIFNRRGDKRLAAPPDEVISAVNVPVTDGIFYNYLTALSKIDREDKCEVKEPLLVLAGALVSGFRSTLSLAHTAASLVNYGEGIISPTLHTIARRIGELSHFTYLDQGVQMHDALEEIDPLQDGEDSADRRALEDEVALTMCALWKREGVWFPFVDKVAFLSRHGSLTRPLFGEGPPGHLFLCEPGEELPTDFDKESNLVVF